MPRRGRPRKNHSIYSFKKLVEYNSDSETDNFNVRNNEMVEVCRQRDRSPLQRPIPTHQQRQNQLPSQDERQERQERQIPVLMHNHEVQSQDEEIQPRQERQERQIPVLLHNHEEEIPRHHLLHEVQVKQILM